MRWGVNKFLLDKLAMEVAEWGVGDLPKNLRWMTIDLNSLRTYARAPDGKLIEEADWIQRRKELINEPSDEDAPFWANWKAQDGSGVWRWFKDKVSSSVRESWYAYDRSAVASTGEIPAGHNWRKTLKEVDRKICNDVDTSELPSCFGVDFGAEANGLDSIQTLCILIDTTDDHVAKLMLQTTLAQVLEREYGVDLSND